jgi:hypothetical protein
MKEVQDALGQNLYIEAMMPLVCSQLQNELSEQDMQSISHANRKVLWQVVELDEFTREAGAGTEISQEGNARLEQKLNLMLDLLGAVIETTREVPGKTKVKISSQEIEWSDLNEKLFNEGDYVKVDVFLHPYSPWPLQLTGNVKQMEETDSGIIYRIRFQNLSDFEQEQMEKLIFRHHRRMIAARKV